VSLAKEAERMSSVSDRMVLGMVVVVIVVFAGVGTWWYVSVAGPTTTTTTTTTTPTLPNNPYSIAIVFATGGLGDKSFNDECVKGANDASAAFDMNFTYVEPVAISEYEGFIRDYCQHPQFADPYELIICIGFDQMDALANVCKEFPNQRFAIVDMYMDPVVYNNTASVVFNENEGSALVGAMAGLVSTTHKIGFVGGMDIPLVNKYAGGYVWGANRSSPGINFTIAYTGDWVNTAAGKALGDAMYTAGYDIIFAVAGRSGMGVIESVVTTNGTKPYPVWAIGSDSPQMYLGLNVVGDRTVVLTSMLKRVDVAVYRQFEQVFLDTWTAGIKIGSVANGLVGYELNTTIVDLDASVYNAIFALENQIAAGTVIVPDYKYWLG